jgi:hypothetical protein
MLVFERNSQWLRTFQDSLWLIVITAFTVGYGDIYPMTFPGRAISICAGILGVIFAALGTAALSNKLSWTTAEFNVSKLLMKNVMEKQLAHDAIVYLQRTFRSITNRTSNHFCLSRETYARNCRQRWLRTKQEFNTFKQNQDNMELLLKGILDDSGKISKVTTFLRDHDATKNWISQVTKGSNHPLQLAVAINVLEEQLKNMESLTAAALQKQSSQSEIGGKATAKISEPTGPFVDPNDGVVDSFISEMNALCDILDENNKDLGWFAKEIDSRVRGVRRDGGPSLPTSAQASYSGNHHQIQSQPPPSQSQPLAPSTPYDSQFRSSSSGQREQLPPDMYMLREQAALQMQFQTALMEKLFESLESPKRNRSRSGGRRSSSSRRRNNGRSRSASAHSSRSRSRHAEAISSGDEADIHHDLDVQSGRDLRALKQPGPRGSEQFDPADSEVWIDDDRDSAASSLPNSRPVSAVGAVNANEQATPRMIGDLNRVKRLHR